MRKKTILSFLCLLLSLFCLQPAMVQAQESVQDPLEEQHPVQGEIPVQLLNTTGLSARALISYCNYLIGAPYDNGYCMRFVADVFENLGLNRSSTCCASHFADLFQQSTDINSIPLGADVFFKETGGGPCGLCGNGYYGHIGIYIGNGRFIHSDSGNIQVSSLDDAYFREHFRGWGMHGGVVLSEEPMTCYVPSTPLYRVSTGGQALILRAMPAEGSTPLARIEDGSILKVSRNHQGWLHASVNGLNGFVSSQYVVPIYASVSFSDMDRSHWGLAYASQMSTLGFMSPRNGAFVPDENVTLAQCLGILYHMLGDPQDSNALYTIIYVNENGTPRKKAAWIDYNSLYPSVQARSDAGIISWALFRNLLSPSELSRLDQPLSKSALARLLCDYLEYKGVLLSNLSYTSPRWNALKDLEWYGGDLALLRCFNAGIISGNAEGYLEGAGYITRAQAAKMLYQAYIF